MNPKPFQLFVTEEYCFTVMLSHDGEQRVQTYVREENKGRLSPRPPCEGGSGHFCTLLHFLRHKNAIGGEGETTDEGGSDEDGGHLVSEK